MYIPLANGKTRLGKPIFVWSASGKAGLPSAYCKMRECRCQVLSDVIFDADGNGKEVGGKEDGRYQGCVNESVAQRSIEAGTFGTPILRCY
ncbi:unnamed protein product [Clonostachys byssicola]|uniref:Uncharacterized protein n=1 Tax=Clonostachys byssicola TaxID=160290 RepID=A0A9N9UPJ5_9HYPO|nr:unnamed protein product [Clonostachys byssicola]